MLEHGADAFLSHFTPFLCFHALSTSVTFSCAKSQQNIVTALATKYLVSFPCLALTAYFQSMRFQFMISFFGTLYFCGRHCLDVFSRLYWLRDFFFFPYIGTAMHDWELDDVTQS